MTGLDDVELKLQDVESRQLGIVAKQTRLQRLSTLLTGITVEQETTVKGQALLSVLDFDIIEQAFEKLEVKKKSLESLKVKIAEVRTATATALATVSELGDVEAKLIEVQKEYMETLRAEKVCPYCFANVSSQTIDNVIQELFYAA